LIVIVDTAPPKVQLSAVRGEAGQITATFRIEEPNPKLDSLAIEYRLASTAAWQAISVGPKDVRSDKAVHRGEVTWYPQNAEGTMEICLRISDMAGNPAESHVQVALPAQAASTAVNPVRPPLGAAPAIPTGVNPLGPHPPLLPTATPAPTSPATALASPAPASVPTPSAAAAQGTETRQPLGSPTGKTAWPAENANQAFSDPAKPPRAQNEAGNSSIALHVVPPVSEQFVAQQQSLPFGASAGQSASANTFQGFTAGPTANSELTAAAAGKVGPPSGVQFRWINSRAFQLDYDTRAVGGITNRPVELWGTRDGGKTWQSLGKDPQGHSPMLVTVPEEGLYGFRMAIQDGPGAAGRPPLSGDVPGYWIGIDLTRPVGRIAQAQQGMGHDGDKLFITWEASDNRQLAAKPISISYSERLGGPWTSMVKDLENTGRYVWQLTGSLPQRIYLRLEILDAAGNLGIYETPEPVSLDLSTPAAQLRDVRPLSWQNPRSGEQTYLR
jgi:hypothetical protein